MFCNKCGTPIEDGKFICSNCGAYLNYGQPTVNNGQPTANNVQPTANNVQQNMYNYQPGYFQPNSYSQMQNNQNMINMSPGDAAFARAERENLGMKWFKFIIFAQLFLNALANVGIAIMHLTGGGYTSKGDSIDGDIVYRAFEDLEILDKVYGVLCIVLVVGAIFVRQKLANFKRKSEKYYLLFLVTNVVLAVLYCGIGTSITQEEIDFWNNGSTATNLCLNVVMVGVNVVYFSKRKHLFVN